VGPFFYLTFFFLNSNLFFKKVRLSILHFAAFFKNQEYLFIFGTINFFNLFFAKKYSTKQAKSQSQVINYSFIKIIKLNH
jgi:hypothetical protein